MSPVVIATLLKLALICPAPLAPAERKALLEYARTGDRVQCFISARRMSNAMQDQQRAEDRLFTRMLQEEKQAKRNA